MSKVRYKTPSFQKTYDAMLAAAQNPAGELYYNGRPHRGAGHRTAFWDGYAGLEHSANVVPGTLSAVCFAAGKAFAKTTAAPETLKQRINVTLDAAHQEIAKRAGDGNVSAGLRVALDAWTNLQSKKKA